MLNNLKKNKSWIIILSSALCMIVALLIVFLVKGIFPFGKENIAYYDMSQMYIPIYYHTWDVLHGDKSAFFDWYSGAGGNMMDTFGNYIFSPYNLLFYLVRRDGILNFMSIFLMIKVAVSSATMSFYFVKKYKNISWIWHIIAGILYASSGYYIQHYSNIHFLDIISIFPLLVWAYEKLICEGKYICYVVLMSLCCLISLYLTGLFCPFLVLYGAVLIQRIKEKKEQKYATFRVALFTMSAILISGVISFPMISSLNDSVRNTIAQSSSYIDIIKTTECLFNGQKCMMLFGSELPLAVIIIYLIIERKKALKSIGAELLILVALILPIRIESINIMLHIIGYAEFPMRFGYIICFLSLVIMGNIIAEKTRLVVCTENNKEKNSSNIGGKKGAVTSLYFLIFFAIVVFTIYVLFKYVNGFLEYGIMDATRYENFWFCFFALCICYCCICVSKRKHWIRVGVVIMVVVQILLGWYGFLAPEQDARAEGSEQIIVGSEEIKVSQFFETDPMNRVKDCSATLSANYPFVMERASVSNWTWGVGNQMMYAMFRLGYSECYTRLLDTGGTVFSDMLFNIKDIITTEETNNVLYYTYDQTENYFINKMNFEYPFGLFVDESFVEWDQSAGTYGLEYQNDLFVSMMGIENDLIELYTEEQFFVESGYDEGRSMYYYVYNIPVDSDTVLYLERADKHNNRMLVSVNNEWIKIPSLNEGDNIVHPAVFNNGIIDCGVYNDEILTVRIECLYEKPEHDLKFGLLRLEVLEESVKLKESDTCTYEVNKTGLKIKKDVEKDGYIFLPIGYSENWKVSVNEKIVTPIAGINDALLLVPIEQGENIITIQYIPNGILYGFCVSVLGMLLFLIGILLEKKKAYASVVLNFARVVYCGMVIGIVIFVYIIPLVANMYLTIKHTFL